MYMYISSNKITIAAYICSLNDNKAITDSIKLKHKHLLICSQRNPLDSSPIILWGLSSIRQDSQ